MAIAVTVPSKTAQTKAAYLHRFKQLKASVERTLGRKCTVTEFAAVLIETTRPGLSPAAWRQYRAAACYGLECGRTVAPNPGDRIDAALAQLRATPPATKRADELRTSQKKAKKLPVDDLVAIQRYVLAGQSPNRQALADYLTAADLTGLRPSEWRRAWLRPSTAPGFEWELTVACAKRTNGRSHGDDRHLRYHKLDTNLVAAIMRWLAVAQEAERTGNYAKLMKALRSLMRNCCADLFARRKQRPAMYTPRHQAAARWKAFYVKAGATPEELEFGRAIVAALLGHATDETATHHYARPDRGEGGSSRLPIPVADPDEVARVRRTFAAKLEAKSAREMLAAIGARP